MNYWLFFVIMLLGLVPIFLLKKYNLKNLKPISPFIWLLFIASLEETSTVLFLLIAKISILTGYWERIYELAEFLTIFFFFITILKPKHLFFFKISITLYITLYVYLLFIWNIDKCKTTSSYLMLLETMFVIAASFLWFKNCFISLEETTLLKTPNFYFISGFLFYFVSTIFLFLITDYLIKNKKSEFWDYYNFNLYANFVWRLLLIIGVCCAFSHKKNATEKPVSKL